MSKEQKEIQQFKTKVNTWACPPRRIASLYSRVVVGVGHKYIAKHSKLDKQALKSEMCINKGNNLTKVDPYVV